MAPNESKIFALNKVTLAILISCATTVAESTTNDVSSIEQTLHQLSTTPGEFNSGLLPEGVTLAHHEWRNGLLRVELNLPLHTPDWQTSLFDMQRISHALGHRFEHREDFRGVETWIRSSRKQKLQSLESFAIRHDASKEVRDTSAAQYAIDTSEDRAVQESTAMFSESTRSGIGGPTASAPTQPTGALTGVVVYCAAGHGWTAGTTQWALQRDAELFGMNEDYGNIDQLNYFVHYAFNAGATVVPFRPVGYQTEEIVVDNAVPEVTYSGAWTSNTSNPTYYGQNAGDRYRFSSASPTETATARYTPNISVTDFYPVYCFAIPGTNRVPQTYRIKHSGGIGEVVVDHREVGNGWVWLGEYHFVAGEDNYVEISNASPTIGVVIADAIRWGNGIGDIPATSQNIVSGYPRDEEAQRYWAQSELGNNANGYNAASIWDSAGSHVSDNISTGSRWAREMNQVPAGGVLADRWKRIYLEFHTNASTGAARGTIALTSSSNPTTNQTTYATTIAEEVEGDMLALSGPTGIFEHDWADRPFPTLAGSFGAISTTGNSNEFDATIIEVAFHDNEQDAELLRDARVRAAVARSSVQGIIRFLNGLPGSQVPLVFPPARPRAVHVSDLGDGDITLAWSEPTVDGAHGDAPDGYVVYSSTNGFGFTIETMVEDAQSGTPPTTVTLSGIPRNKTMYYRVSAANDGGVSAPSGTIAIRRPPSGAAAILVVNGYDRLRRQQNPVTLFTQPPSVAGLAPERPVWRRINSFDYIVEYAQAIAGTGRGFVSCENEAVEQGHVLLSDYENVVWGCGAESVEDTTLSATEQTLLADYLDAGRGLFITGSDLAFDLVDQGTGAIFASTELAITFSANDSGTFDVDVLGGGIFSALTGFDFDPGSGARYEVGEPDVLGVNVGGEAALEYAGGSIAGVQFDAPGYRTVSFGFPFETISSESARIDVMAAALTFLDGASVPLLLDADGDGDLDLTDYQIMNLCLAGPDVDYPDGNFCLVSDGNEDLTIDLADFHLLQQLFTGPLP